ncbi:MAG: hypothetical protein QOD30_2217 [Actinomycetota bacterium]|nr:hypothetical protein [Actinomycetota bacterium]
MKRRVVFAVAGLLVAMVVAVALVATRDHPTGLARVRVALHDDDRFVNGPTAGETIATASEWLLDDGESCEAAHGRGDPRCAARLSAAAYTSVAAVGLVDCTAPGVFQTRRALVRYIDDIATFDHEPLGTLRVPSPPHVPAC